VKKSQPMQSVSVVMENGELILVSYPKRFAVLVSC